jgi:hypothetical protein
MSANSELALPDESTVPKIDKNVEWESQDFNRSVNMV